MTLLAPFRGRGGGACPTREKRTLRREAFEYSAGRVREVDAGGARESTGWWDSGVDRGGVMVY